MDNEQYRFFSWTFLFLFFTLKALHRTAYESWNVGEILLNQWCQRFYHSCKNHISYVPI